jgi:hypothetical protein
MNMKYFEYSHLPENLQAVSKRFAELANYINSFVPSVEREMALRKLLETKDCAVRASMEKDGYF